MIIYYTTCVKELNYTIRLWFLFRSTSLDVQHSRDGVAFFHLSLLGGNCPVVNSGRLCRVLPKSGQVCLVQGLLLLESPSEVLDPR